MDKERNKALAIEICAKYNSVMPTGLTLYTTQEAFGINYRHPEKAHGGNTGVQVGFNLSAKEFDLQADDACEAVHRLAKAMNRQFDVPMVKSNAVIECEKTMVDGKCACGYSAKASESAQELRSMVGVTYHTGSGQKTLKSRIDKEGDIIW